MSTENNTPSTWRNATRAVRGGTERSQFSETSEALYLNSGYVYGSAEEAEAAFDGSRPRYVYSRYANPTVTMFENRLALIEGAEFARGTAAGMSAVFCSMACFLETGSRVVASRAIFGSCHYIINDILPKYGIETHFVDGCDLEQWKQALSVKTDAVFVESPSNPTLEIIDVKAVCDLAHEAGAKVIVDNVFASPSLQHPLEMGADVVVYSTTKHIDGQGRCLGGAVLSNDQAYMEDQLGAYLKHTGPAMSPFNAWVMLKGLETLDLRMERHCVNAAKVAEFLSTHDCVERTLYPGLPNHPQHELAMSQMRAGGSVVTLNVKGGKAEAFSMLNNLTIMDISNNLGDAKSLATHPATTTHQRMSPEERALVGIGDSMIRVSVGLEDVDDLIEDLDRALRA
jgi:O-succinylhomoserine sulfhydrylase